VIADMLIGSSSGLASEFDGGLAEQYSKNSALSPSGASSLLLST